ncbi:MAG: SufD family Fe-S cluster assembly protein, partial [Vicinamibacterales bacterium]
MTQLAERHGTYTAGFDAFRRTPAFGQGGLAGARESAFNRFLTEGFPTTRNEEWRHTNLAPIASSTYSLAPDVEVDDATNRALNFDGALESLVVVVNGRVRACSPRLTGLVSVGAGPKTPTATLLPARPASAGVFVDLNTAFFEDVVVLDVPAHAVLEDPIHVLFVAAAEGASLISPRLLIRAGEQSQCSVVESYADLDRGTAWVNAVTDVQLADGAVVDHVKLQRQGSASFHLASMFVHLNRSSTFTSRAITLGGRISRNDI